MNPPQRVNIIMIFTDDQRADAVGHSGNDAIRTPNLDKLARGGLVFRNCFVNTWLNRWARSRGRARS